MADDADTDDWKFSVDEVGPDADAATNGQDDEVDLSKGDVPAELVEDGEEAGGNVAGSLTSLGPIEPQSPTLENALFVVLGVYLAVFGLAGMVAPGFVSAPRTVAILAGGLFVLAALSFAVFGLLTPDT
jgi:hypothetical protein